MGIKVESPTLPGVSYLANNDPFVKHHFETKEPIITEAGNNLWQVDTVLTGERGIEELSVTIEAPKNPVEGIALMTPLVFKDLVLIIGKMGNGKKYYSLRASSVKAA